MQRPIKMKSLSISIFEETNVDIVSTLKYLTKKPNLTLCLSRPFFHPFLMNWRFALLKRGACLIEYLCTLFIWVDEFYLWIISFFDLCGS